ncbi:hypothetical protein HNY73_015972 [Argiope bruennichi]|uniref:Uncharacterized protein n=1 Tax=Argiope bruennichi TaxID=94029 RepID=A0A8T0EIF4_ARGBR|nr:hypothetical protein HNY73_015972 [Argiope bruennichi]
MIAKILFFAILSAAVLAKSHPPPHHHHHHHPHHHSHLANLTMTLTARDIYTDMTFEETTILLTKLASTERLIT